MDVKKIVSQMTLDEKCSLLSGADFWHTKAVERLGVEQVMVSDGPHGLRKQDMEGDHLGMNDSIKAVCFPAGCASTASFDRDLVRQIGEALGDACQHEGVSVVLGPAVNIKRSPLCGRNFEYLSEDPYLAGEMATGLIQGVQSRNVGTSIKHFAANSQEHRRMSSSSEVDERTFREIYLPAFEAAVKNAKPWTVMCSYNRINGVYACENKELLTTILRDEWGFDGYVMSDWGATDDRIACVDAGLDLEMPASGGSNDKRVADAVRAGKLDEAIVDKAVERILNINARFLENAKPETVWDKDAQHELARELAAQCMVLLKNEENILPLTKGESVAIIGAFAKTPRYQGGGSSHINSCKVTSLMDALEGADGVTYAEGYSLTDFAPNADMIAAAVEAAKNAKTAVIVAGLPDAFESEGYDRSHMGMPENQNALIAAVAAANPNTVVVLYNGSPVEMPWVNDVKAIVEGYLGGQAVGGATMDVLFGNVNPSGRLPETFPIQLEDNPSFLSYVGEGDRVEYREGVFVGYRYYDKKKMKVLFPFGYGLSYTEFAYSNMTVSAEKIDDTQTLTVTVDVTNTGKVAGKEVVQLYVGDVESTPIRPVQELKGFEKVSLQPGETKTVSFTLCKRAFAYWNTTLHDWHVESGEFVLRIGKSSRDIVLEKTVTVESAVTVPSVVTVNTIAGDIMKNPKAMELLMPFFDGARKLFSAGEQSEAAADAINSEMMEAMIRYMPLRGVMSFAGGNVTYDELKKMLEPLNK